MSELATATPVRNVWRNHNVLLTLIVRAADGLSAGIWNGATLAAYIYLIQHNSNKVPVCCLVVHQGDTDVHARTWMIVIQARALTANSYVLRKYVGIAEGIFGIFCAAAGIPAGWIADRMRRDRTLRLCGFVMLGVLPLQPWPGQQRCLVSRRCQLTAQG